ncbi:MAG: ATP-binding protein, partial [Mariprofundaceae bacterium]
VFSALGYLFVTDRERAARQKQLHFNYLKSIERLERALNQTSDMKLSLNQALNCLLETFQCHRAWLLTPCDPHASQWNVPFECTTPDYPGLFPSATGMPVTPEVQAFFRENLQSIQPRSTDSTLPMLDNDTMRAFSVQSQLAIALNLDHDTHWLLGLHQCDHEREWSNSEKKLFQDCANRMQDALNQMILYQQLKKSEQQLRQAIKQADAANHAKSEFLSLMSHELRTPLHGIIGLQELLFNDAENLSDEQKEYIQLSQQAGQSLRSLVNDILDLSKAESGHAVAAQKSFDPLNCLRDVLVPFIATAKQKGIELSLQLEHVPTQIIGDSPRLRQSLLNLVGNAIKFTQQGFVRLHISHKLQDGKPQLIFSVSDSGCGIAPEYMKSLFEPFTQANTLMTPEHEGTGLGTTIVKRFVELMGGSITVTSTLGQGSCFSFNIPCQADSNMIYLQKLQASNIAAFINDKHVQVISSTSKLRVLLAEDDLISQRIAVKSMQRAGIQVTVVSNGHDAWDELQQHDYDLLLTDIRMPKLSGIELTQRIREVEAHYSRPELPIIGFSAHAMEEVERQCKAAGMNDFMTKPIEPEAIVKRILASKPTSA